MNEEANRFYVKPPSGVLWSSLPRISSTSLRDNRILASMQHISSVPELDLAMHRASSSLICLYGNSGREEGWGTAALATANNNVKKQQQQQKRQRLTLKTAEMRVNWDGRQLPRALSCELASSWQAAHCISHHASDRSFRNTQRK